ncbi:MAG: Ig-like domain-containing protein, partial [Candidatus Pacebacteria bacterium]|nr:Ig-like domain-containing protein [Candidatus Paceibacterota bacterium]
MEQEEMQDLERTNVASTRARLTEVRARVASWVRHVWTQVTTFRPSRAARIAGVALLVVGAGVAWYAYLPEEPAWYAYSESYRLVPESISASAAISIVLPEGTPAGSEQAVTFTPEIEGTFVASQQERVMRFQPAEPLTIGSYYGVALAQGESTLSADFLVADDPRIVSILPSADAEVHEDTEISVIFNRPMVPLSTRAVMDDEEVPVRLEPAVPGTWQWKSTRLLQFTPEEDFVRATHYTVTVNEGFRSLDGVGVPGFTHSFTTRTLKFEAPPSTVHFDSPLEVVFNQEVDLVRTAREVKLRKNGQEIEPLVSYASVEREGGGLFGLTLFSGGKKVDKTRVWIRPKEDMHGREGLWDFTAFYELSVPKQYPAEGEIVSENSIDWSYTLPEVLSSLSAVSKRSDFAEPTFFDPEGELVATFFEPVDLKETRLSLEGVRHVAYGTQCKTTEDGRNVIDPASGTCATEENKHELRITVDPTVYPRGKEATLTFERVVREGGLVLSYEPIVRPIRAIPDFVLYRTVPDTGTTSASLTRFALCSNTPLVRPESLRDMLRTEGYVVYPDHAWRPSFRVYGQNDTCNDGEFETMIEYGLHPERGYEFSLALTDAFGAKLTKDVRFTTQAVSNAYTRFHTMQKWYNVTVPGKTRLLYATENLPAVAAHLCKVSPQTMLRVLDGMELGNKFPDASLCESVRVLSIDLPDVYWVNNYFHFDIKEYIDDVRGHYIITFTHLALRTEGEQDAQRYEHTLLTVSNLTVGEKSANRNSWRNDAAARIPEPTPRDLYWVLGANTLDPILGAKVTSYVGKSDEDSFRGVLTQHAQGTTDVEGVVRMPAAQYTRGAIITFGGDTAVVSARTDTLMHEWSQGGESRTYLYTDRPIYRPGDTVHVRGIDRVGFDQVWRVTEGYTTTLTVTDSRGEVIHTEALPVSRYGTFEATVTLPADASLGGYSIQAAENGYGWFEVEEYVAAPFKAEVQPVESEYMAGETAEFDLSAQYYFDMPVADAEVEYTVLAQDYHFDRYTDEYFNFGADWYSCYWCGYGDSFITRGTVTLTAEGTARIEFPLDFATQFENPNKVGSKLYTVIARVTDRSGKQIAAQNTVIVHRGEYYLGAKVEPYMVGSGQ